MSQTKADLTHEVVIQVEDDRWCQWYTQEQWQVFLSEIIMKALRALAWPLITEVSLLLSNNAHVQELNKRYRHQDKPTNVLSFPSFGKEELTKLTAHHEPVILGDIVLAFEVVLEESEQQKKHFLHHLTHLTVHGLLHLLGYDHETDPEADEMEATEISILNNLGITNPYQ